ncbi:MAG TPA: hypothetical protein VGI61_06640 [Parafilimonas sp.]
MSNHSAPHDPKKFTIQVFIFFVVVFVFVMLMMLWHGNVSSANGQRHYQTQLNEP